MASRIATRAFSTTARRLQSEHVLKQETKRNPELMILGAVMVAAFGGAGLYFGRTPTSSTSEQKVPHAGNPWETGGTGKYQYYPGGDRSAEPKDAPSAINTVVVPDVNLPKELHEKYNKWGKDGY
ncbi:hypothetical protein INS49_001358 [Diaporthe citri]|uniref:uncharacterized protein n=1 Tax=Diaporthe citri TaxID=83186 RepID=UPI001C82408D|nr:uncharacterized protein INS49_001358 [Diaporthe citri]KAG6367174.1 hypothetical protein INS49_001358 [Diaporthe citri]